MGLPTGLKSEREIETLKTEYEKTQLKPMDDLIDDSIHFMESLMRGVATEKYNIESVGAACKCSHQIYLLRRLKLEIDKNSRGA